jgi:hypothetical protein
MTSVLPRCAMVLHRHATVYATFRNNASERIVNYAIHATVCYTTGTTLRLLNVEKLDRFISNKLCMAHHCAELTTETNRILANISQLIEMLSLSITLKGLPECCEKLVRMQLQSFCASLH